jgi:hypothetical protein
MKSIDHLQTMKLTYQEICQGEEPWVALGDFMNDWFDYAQNRRVALVAEAIVLPESFSDELWRWAVFCVAAVDYLCARYDLHCPSWVYNPAYTLATPWFDALSPEKPQVRARLIQQTPEQFKKRNIYCGNRVFNNKYELVEQYHHLPIFSSPTSAS